MEKLELRKRLISVQIYFLVSSKIDSDKNCFSFNSTSKIKFRKETYFSFFGGRVYLFILLYNIILVLPYIDLNPPWVYIFLYYFCH